MEAVVFTSQGDMRQALNNLQSTKEGFGLVKSENVFKVCDEPHPLLIKDMLTHCNKGSLDDAYKIMNQVQFARETETFERSHTSPHKEMDNEASGTSWSPRLI